MSNYRGITHGLPTWSWLLWTWRKLLCARDIHMFDEVSSAGDEEGWNHYLSCDACNLMVEIGRISDEYVEPVKPPASMMTLLSERFVVDHRYASLFVLSDDDWKRYYREFPDGIKDVYRQRGFLKMVVNQNGMPTASRDSGQTGLLSTTYKGVPVVRRVSYERIKHQINSIYRVVEL